MRVASLLPAATEVLCQIGGRNLLVARSHECDHPPGLQAIPALTEQTTHFDPAAGVDAAAIDRAVREQTAAGRALYNLNTQRLADLRPDLILTQETCAVCSVDAATVRTIARHMQRAFGRRPEVLSLDPHTVEDVLDNHLAVGAAVKMLPEAREAVAKLRERLFRAEEHVTPFAAQPVVGFLEWTDPLFIAGHWTVELIERSGGRHPLNETVVTRPTDGAAIGPQRGARRAGKSVRVPPEALVATTPEFLVIAPCGLNLDQAMGETQRLMEHAWFRDLPAVRAGRVAVVDGSAMFNRPGPRLVDAFEFLVGWLQERPELVPAGFPWRQFPG